MSAVSILPASAELLAVIDRWHAFMQGTDPDALDDPLHDEFETEMGAELEAMASRS